MKNIEEVTPTCTFQQGRFLDLASTSPKSADLCICMEDNDAFGQLLQLRKQLTDNEKEGLKRQLIVHINDLLLNDFNRLVQILYRVDVSEQKLKNLLKDNPQTDAAVIIADLLIERQDQKIKTKQSFRSNDNIASEDRW
ncbi:MAG: hypothetical protein ACXVBK_16000 [Flavisolibacter sp.]